MFTRTAVLSVLVVGLAGCADDGPRGSAATATTLTAATDLAPSQIVASTVARPAAVPPCDLADLEFGSSDETVILIRNIGPVECEVDVSQSPNRDPSMEPSVWIHPGGEAELAIEADDSRCERPEQLTRVELVVNGEPVAAPIVLPATCGATLIAIYTAE
jgi:hypothetical protein